MKNIKGQNKPKRTFYSNNYWGVRVPGGSVVAPTMIYPDKRYIMILAELIDKMVFFIRKKRNFMLKKINGSIKSSHQNKKVLKPILS